MRRFLVLLLLYFGISVAWAASTVSGKLTNGIGVAKSGAVRVLCSAGSSSNVKSPGKWVRLSDGDFSAECPAGTNTVRSLEYSYTNSGRGPTVWTGSESCSSGCNLGTIKTESSG